MPALAAEIVAVRRFLLQFVNDGSCYVLSWTYTASRFWIDLRIERAHKFYVRQIFFVTCLMLGFGPGQQFWSQHTAGQGSLPMLRAICADLSTHFLGRDQWLMREVERILSASPSGSQWHHVHHWQCRWKTWVIGWGDVAVVYGTFGEREDWSWTSQVLHLLLDDFKLHAALLHFYLCLMVLQKIVYNCNANYMYLQHRCIDSDVHSFVYGNFSIHPI